MQENGEFDQSGKIVLSQVYDQPDPRPYFSKLRDLDYSIPQHAKPVFSRLIQARRALRDQVECKVVDIGCSYGVNGALLKHALEMDDLYDLYSSPAALAMDRAELLERDQAIFEAAKDPDLEFVGVDLAASAIGYAVDAGALDEGVAADFEAAPPTPEAVTKLAGADLIISTGCYGYVSETSLDRVMEPSRDRAPWMAHFVLRMFPFDAARDMLSERGYQTEEVPGVFPQRRFSSDAERDNAMANLDKLGLEPTPMEREGWYVAGLHVSRPLAEVHAMPARELLVGLTPGLEAARAA
jgi:carnitine O-acetyltransferase